MMPDTHLFGLCCEARDRTESVAAILPECTEGGFSFKGVYLASTLKRLQPQQQARKNLQAASYGEACP